MLLTLNGAISAFKNIYLEMVNMLLTFLHLLRVGNWKEYLASIREFLQYSCSLNRHIAHRVFRSIIVICYGQRKKI